MAPELRKKKSKSALSAPSDKPAAPSKKAPSETKPPKVEKRKANEDASPVAKKKQKAVKGTDVAVTKKKPAKEVEQKEIGSSDAPVSKKGKSAKKTKEDKKKPVAEPAPQEEADGVPSDDEEEEVDVNTQALVETLDSDAEDSDSSPHVSTYKKGQDVGKIPKPKKVAKLANGAASGKPGVMYLGSIPHGFYEHEIREYFSQFGEITRLRVVRNKKTGASRHHAFVEFADAEVADIAARTMDNYLLFGHILRAKTVPPEQVHPQLFKGANRRFKVIPWNAMVGRHLERPLGETKWQGKIAKEEERRAARAEKLKALMDYEYEAPALKAAEAKQQAEQIQGGDVEAVEAPAVKQIADKEDVEADMENEAAVEVAAPELISQKAKKTKKGTKAKKVKA